MLASRRRECLQVGFEPSPTADATRFTLPARTSPTAKTPGRLASNICGARGSGHGGFSSGTPVQMLKPRQFANF